MSLKLNPLTGSFDVVSVDAPKDASYLTLGTNTKLTSERVATASSNVTITDAGAGSTATFDLSNTGVSAATYGALNTIPVIAIDAKGRITSASNSSIIFPVSPFNYTTINGTSGSITPASSSDTYTLTSTNGVTLVAANGSPDTITVNTPQDVQTSASPTFVKCTLSGTGASNGLIVSDCVWYRTSADTWKTDDRTHFAPPTNTATSGSYIGALLQVNSGPASSSSARHWGLQFAVAHNTAQNLTDGTSGITGIEGYARNESTGTVTREVGGLFYTDNTAAGTVSNAIGVWTFNSTSNASAVTNEYAGLRVSGGTVTGTTTAWYGVRLGAPAYSANSQTRVGLRVEAMPDPGAFTGTTGYAINIEGTSRAIRDGIRIGGDVEVYSSAANTLRLGNSDSLEFSAGNIITDTTTGTKIGTATTQKLSFWNATPIVQPTTAVAAATFVANTSAIANDTATFDGYTIGQVVKALRNIGVLA